jgi:hypothetical protein
MEASEFPAPFHKPLPVHGIGPLGIPRCASSKWPRFSLCGCVTPEVLLSIRALIETCKRGAGRFEPTISRATTWRLNHWATLTTTTGGIILHNGCPFQSRKHAYSRHSSAGRGQARQTCYNYPFLKHLPGRRYENLPAHL